MPEGEQRSSYVMTLCGEAMKVEIWWRGYPRGFGRLQINHHCNCFSRDPDSDVLGQRGELKTPPGPGASTPPPPPPAPPPRRRRSGPVPTPLLTPGCGVEPGHGSPRGQSQGGWKPPGGGSGPGLCPCTQPRVQGWGWGRGRGRGRE